MVVNGFELFVDFCRPLRFCIIVVVCIVSFCVRRFLHGGILMENNSLRPTHRRHWINAKRVDDDGDNGDDDVDDEVDEFAFACAYAFLRCVCKGYGDSDGRLSRHSSLCSSCLVISDAY